MKEPMEFNSSPEAPLGTHIRDFTDVKRLQNIVCQLWSLLDHIDTLDDIWKENHEGFQKSAYKYQQKRHKYIVSDGYALYVPDSEQ